MSELASAARALREAAVALEDGPDRSWSQSTIAFYLRDRADRVEDGEYMTDDETSLVEALQGQMDVNERMGAEMLRLGQGVERIAAKYGADHPEIADALHRLLRGYPPAGDDSIERLDALGTDDPEGTHIEADKILLAAVDPKVADAYRRVVERTRWWAYA